MTNNSLDPWRDEAFQEMAKLWDLSQQDQDKMRTLQGRLHDIDYWKNDPFEVVRYYKEYRGKLEKAETMFRRMVKWRLENRMDEFVKRHGSPDPRWHQLPIQILDTVDREGDPIYLDRCGVADSYGFLQCFGMDAMQDYLVYIRELAEQREFWRSYEERVGHRMKYYTVVMDLQGLNAGHLRPGLLPLLNRVGRIAQDFYAGTGKRFILLRAPGIFKIVWSIARHFFDSHIQELIVFTNHKDYLEVVQEYIELKNLPSCIAPEQGTAKPMPGYFENVSLEGGSLVVEEKRDSTRSTVSCSTTSTIESTSSRLLLKGVWDDKGGIRTWNVI